MTPSPHVHHVVKYVQIEWKIKEILQSSHVGESIPFHFADVTKLDKSSTTVSDQICLSL